MLIDLIYPPVCGICEQINKKNLCKKCEIEIKKYQLNNIEKVKDKNYDYQIKILKYENIIRKKIIDYKFNEKSYLYKTFGKIILNNKKIYSFLKKYDIILCVPMYKEKKKQRGYNQAELITKELAKKLHIDISLDNLVKMKDTKKQSTLTKTERMQNLKGVFEVKNKGILKNKNVILFDDIFTTGSTVNECCNVLKKAGAKGIAVLTLAVD